MTLAARILNHIAPLGYQDSAPGFVRGVEPVREINLVRPRAQQRPDVMADGLGQGGAFLNNHDEDQ